MGACNCCGACCRVLTVAQGPEEIRTMAALARVLGIPSDMVFAAAHWRPLSRQEAARLNPYYVGRLPPGAHLYSCDCLGPDGRCRVYEERPLVCRGYPWYGQPVRDMPLPDPACGYHADIEAARRAGPGAGPESG